MAQTSRQGGGTKVVSPLAGRSGEGRGLKELDRRRIVAATIDVVATAGYSATRTNDIMAVDRSPVVLESLVGGLYEVAYVRTFRGEVADLPGLVPELTQIVLVTSTWVKSRDSTTLIPATARC